MKLWTFILEVLYTLQRSISSVGKKKRARYFRLRILCKDINIVIAVIVGSDSEYPYGRSSVEPPGRNLQSVPIVGTEKYSGSKGCSSTTTRPATKELESRNTRSAQQRTTSPHMIEGEHSDQAVTPRRLHSVL